MHHYSWTTRASSIRLLSRWATNSSLAGCPSSWECRFPYPRSSVLCPIWTRLDLGNANIAYASVIAGTLREYYGSITNPRGEGFASEMGGLVTEAKLRAPPASVCPNRLNGMLIPCLTLSANSVLAVQGDQCTIRMVLYAWFLSRGDPWPKD